MGLVETGLFMANFIQVKKTSRKQLTERSMLSGSISQWHFAHQGLSYVLRKWAGEWLRVLGTYPRQSGSRETKEKNHLSVLWDKASDRWHGTDPGGAFNQCVWVRRYKRETALGLKMHCFVRIFIFFSLLYVVRSLWRKWYLPFCRRKLCRRDEE